MSYYCPYCGVEIIEGSDTCEQCGQTLTDLSLPMPASQVEINLLGDRVELLDPKPPSTVTSDTPVGEVLAKMVQETIGCVMVVDEDQFVGIFSERDALMRINIDAARLSKQPIGRFMTTNPETVKSNDKIAFALHKMNVGGYRHLPVLDKGKLQGVVSIRDILAYLTDRISASR